MKEGQDDYSVDDFDELSKTCSSTKDGSAEIDAILSPTPDEQPLVGSVITCNAIATHHKTTGEKEDPACKQRQSPPKFQVPLLQQTTVDVSVARSKMATNQRRLKSVEPISEPAYTLRITTPKPKRIKKAELKTFLQKKATAKDREVQEQADRVYQA